MGWVYKGIKWNKLECRLKHGTNSHLRQQDTYRRGCDRSSSDQRHDSVAVHGAVHLPVGGQHEARRPEAGLAHSAAAALQTPRQEERPPAAVALLEGAVLVVGEVVLGAHVACPAPEAEQAGAAVPPRGEEGSSDTEERLGERGKGIRGLSDDWLGERRVTWC